jgi:hypothetical protein
MLLCSFCYFCIIVFAYGIYLRPHAASSRLNIALHSAQQHFIFFTLCLLFCRAFSGGDGWLEVMLQRRCAVDDGYGVGETLNENDVIDPTFLFLLDNRATSVQQHRKLSLLHQYVSCWLLLRYCWFEILWYSFAGSLQQSCLPPQLFLPQGAGQLTSCLLSLL